MSLKTIVKVGGITNLSDARYCAGMGVDMLGFCFSKGSENFIVLDKFKEISNWVTGVEIIAEFENEILLEVEKVFLAHDFDGIMTSNYEVANAIKSLSKKVIFNINIDSENDMLVFNEKMDLYADFDYIQVNTHHEKLYVMLIELLNYNLDKINILKAFDIQTDNIEAHINDGLFKGIALMGSQEEKPGMKDYDEIADILELLDEEG